MTDDADPLIGMLVSGRYRILKLLGEGGMGQVYLAEHEAIEKKVALKVLRPEYSIKPEIVVRFQREAISASRIKHPNVLDVFDFGRLDNDCFFLAMEFLEGNDLADELVRARVLEPLRGVRLALQIMRALAAAHSRGVVHRDMKPENVFLQHTGDGEEIVKIVDFGIAQLRSNDDVAASEPKRRRLTKTGMIFGTPEYMAPEQAGGKNSDLRVDVYALGVIMYEMFTGAVPFTGDTFVGVLTRHLHDPPPHMISVCPDLAISPELQAIIMQALAKDPTARHQSMSDFAQAILSTPEGMGAGSVIQRGSMLPNVPPSQFMGAMSTHPTAAQFGSNQAHATAAQFGAGAVDVAAPHVVHTPVPIGPAPGEDIARAQTQLGAETAPPTQPPGKKSRWPLAAAGAGAMAIVVVGAIVALGAARRSTGTAQQPSAETTSPPTAVPTTPPVASSVAVETPAPSASVASTSIKLTVVTDPEGAVLMKNGFQVCDRTPCEVVASKNETLQFEAQKGKDRGTAKVLAQRDQKVEIKLAAAPPKKGASKPVEKPCLRERMAGDIKIVEVIPCPK